MIELGGFVRDIFKLNEKTRNFRIFGPDETMSNRLGKIFEATNRDWNNALKDNDEFLAKDGRVMDSMLSEAYVRGLAGRLSVNRTSRLLCKLRGIYPNRGFHGGTACKMAKGMFNQLPWRQSIASFNLILSSNVWQQDHNGFTHQDPGFLDHIANKKADVVRMYLPPDANCLLILL